MLFSHKKKEVLPFSTTRMDLESILLSEISQTEKDKNCMIHLYVKSKKRRQSKKKKNQTCRTSLPEGRGEGGGIGEGGQKVQTSSYKINKD